MDYNRGFVKHDVIKSESLSCKESDLNCCFYIFLLMYFVGIREMILFTSCCGPVVSNF